MNDTGSILMITSNGPRLRTADPGDYDRIVAVVDDWSGRPIRSILPRLFLDHFHRTARWPRRAVNWWGSSSDSCPLRCPTPPTSTLSALTRAFAVVDLAAVFYQRFFELARDGHRTSIRAITSQQNHTSIAFHTAMGFTVMGPVPDYDGPEVDRIVFQAPPRLATMTS